MTASEVLGRLAGQDHVKHVEGIVTLTPSGEELLGGLGVEVATIRKPTQATVCTCLDRTQRRHHLAGRAANAMFSGILDSDWLVREATPRSVRVTNIGAHRTLPILWAC